MKPNEINPNKINKRMDLNGLRRVEIKGTFVFIKIFSQSDIGNIIQPHKRKGDQFGVILPLKTGEPIIITTVQSMNQDIYKGK
jgi:hypothetical protein